MENYDIFISYRRDGGEGVAGRISDKLTAKGYKVFFDVESMRSGNFNEQILDAIDMSSDMIVVLPPNGLDRCVSEEDWVRREIAHAIRVGKNIVPVMLRNFEFPKELPDDINGLRLLQGVTASNEYFDAVISRIEKLLECRKQKEILPQGEEIPQSKIKIPFFLRTPVVETLNFDIHFRGRQTFPLDSDYQQYWWNVVNSVDLPEDDAELEEYLINKLRASMKYNKDLLFYNDKPYFIRVKSIFGENNEVKATIDIPLFVKWMTDYKLRHNLYLVPKRYKDDKTNPAELMYEVADLAQTCFYNANSDVDVFYILEMIILGKTLMAGYSRKKEFSFHPITDFCMKCIMGYDDIYRSMEVSRGKRDVKVLKYDRIVNRVSAMISDGARLCGVYEDAGIILNNRVKFFLKYLQLISMYMVPSESGDDVRLYILRNYKYLKKNNVALTKENEELFEMLINIYSML